MSDLDNRLRSTVTVRPMFKTRLVSLYLPNFRPLRYQLIERPLRLSLVSLMLSLLLVWVALPTPATVGTVQASVRIDEGANNDPNLLGAALPTPVGTPLGRLAASRQVEFEVGLALPDAAAAEQFVASLNDQSSPNYHHYLTPAQYTARFNPTAIQQAAVVDYLTRQGFTVTDTSPNHLVLQVRAPAATVERTFHTRLGSYRYADSLSGENFDYFAPQNKVMLPAALQGLVSVVNLNGFPLQRIGSHQISASTQTGDSKLMSLTAGLTPSELRQLYDLGPFYNSNIDGAGQTIALFELGDFNPANAVLYAQNFNLPQPNLSVVKVGNSIGITRAEAEIELDIEVIMAIAPRANIVVYEGVPNGFSIVSGQVLNRIVTDNAAEATSISYGACENGYTDSFSADAVAIVHTILLQGAAQGQTFFAASGDSGAFECSSGRNLGTGGNPLGDALGVSYPASDPNVVAVGGTEFGQGGSVAAPREQVWREAPSGTHGFIVDGTGGGISSIFKKSSWQVGAGVNNSYSNGNRQVPDVAALAGAPGYQMVIRGSLVSEGGTSAACPLWAAASLLINQAAGKQVFSADKLYSAASRSGTAFHDITVGNNGDSVHYPATAGYDLATGLGTPDFAHLYNTMLGAGLPGPTATPIATTPPTTAPPPATTVAGTTATPTLPPGNPAPSPTTPTPAPPPATPTPSASPNPAAPVAASTLFGWKKYSVTPVFPPGASGAWDSGAVYPQSVIWDSGSSQYRMWYVGSSGGNAPALGYATSLDAINWTRNPNPVLTAGPASNWDNRGIFQAAVIYDPNEKVYKLWYSSNTSYTALSIGYAISSDGVNWTKDASPVMLAGPTAFDFGGIQPSTVIKENGQYKLWYEAIDDQNHRSLAYAYSLDGVHWAKPQSANITINGAVYNSDGPGAPSVVHYQNGYYLWYHTSTNIMQASSPDGLNFSLDPATGPVLDVSASGAGDSARLIIPRVVIRSDNNQAVMLYTGYNGATWSGMLATNVPGTPGPQPSPTPTPQPTVPSPTNPPSPSSNHSFADPAFQSIWNRTDQPVLNGAAARSWLWGPQPQASGYEQYAEAQGGLRLVQYFDKGRLEINNPGADRNQPYFASSGLLAKEMLTGNVQIGDNSYNNIGPSNVPVAGDGDDANGPTYATFGKVLNAASVQVGLPEISAIDRNGDVADYHAFAIYGATAAFYVPETKHSIASPFWNYLNSSGLVYDNSGKAIIAKLFAPTFYVTGLPLTEAYWAKVKVGGQIEDVLIQVFERRVLTYTPANNAAFQVEMGNVGRAYFQWRYNQPLS